MNRAEKSATIEQFHETFTSMPNVFVASFKGLSVNQVNELRRKVRGAGGSYSVIRNRLARRAAAGTAAESVSARFRGPCAVVAHPSDPVVLAKVLQEFAKSNPQVELVAGVVEARQTVDAAGIRALATLPGLPQLRAQLLALIQTPATLLLRLLQTPGTQVLRAVDARREKLGPGGEPVGNA